MKDLPDEAQQQSLKSYVWPNGVGKRQEDESPGLSIHIPDDTLLALYRSQTWVHIDKAQKMLGYAPRFNFEQGMDLTSQFIRWANLI